MSDDDTVKHWLAANTIKPLNDVDFDVLELLAERKRNEIIEQCARELEAAFAECSTLNLLHGAARLRALKEPE